MKSTLKLTILFLITTILFNCSKEDDGNFNIEITNPFNQDILIKSSLIVSTSIPSYGSFSLTGTAGEGSLYAVDLYCDNNCPILGEQGSVSGNTIFNFIDGENYRWTAGSNSIQTSSNGDSDGGNHNLGDCKEWTEQIGACYSNSTNVPGVRHRWCKKDLGNGNFEYTVVFEPINGGVDESSTFYKKVKIVTGWETKELTPFQFNSQGGYTSSRTFSEDVNSLDYYIECGL